MAELADAQDLGSCVHDVGVQVPFPAPLMQIDFYQFFIIDNKRSEMATKFDDVSVQVDETC